MCTGRHALRQLARSAATLLALSGLVMACGEGGELRPDSTQAAAAAAAAAAQTARPAPVPVMPVDVGALAPRAGARARSIAVRRDTSTFGVGPAVAMLASGDTVVVSDSAVRAWTLGDGRLVAVSGLDGAGGYENEGQSLTVIDLVTGRRRRVVADYFAIVSVQLVADGAAEAVLVQMRDGGLGSLHVTVVDPARGQVFRATNALARVQGTNILVAGFGDTETPVTARDTRTPLRVDTIAVRTVGTRGLLTVPRGPQ